MTHAYRSKPQVTSTGAETYLRGMWRAALVAVVVLSSVRAAEYDLSVGDAQNRTMRMWMADRVPVVRGILIWGNGANSDARGAAADPEVRALVGALDFAVIGTSMWQNFSDPAEIIEFERSIRRLADRSGHPELVNAPWMPVGHSNGGQMSWGLNALRPSQVLLVAVNKGGVYASAQLSGLALRTPGVLVAGSADEPYRRDAIRGLFNDNRPRGALLSWAEEQGIPHVVGDSYELILPFAWEVQSLRYPAWASPATGPVPLTSLNEADGWLTDPDSFPLGLATIASYASYARNRSTAGWLPSRRMAYIFRALASFNPATMTASVNTGTAPVELNTPVTYTIGPPTVAWTSIDFYEGDSWLKQTLPGEVARFSATVTPTAPGYVVLHGLVTLTNGSQRTTPPRRVFVRPAPPVAATLTANDDPAHVAAGRDLDLVADVPNTPGLTLQWQRDGVDLAGATSATYSIPVVQAFHAGTYSLIATRGGRSATSAPIVVSIDLPPATGPKLINLSTRAMCQTGDNLLIPGFVISGAGTKPVLLRAVGPALADFNVNGVLPDPRLEVKQRVANAWVQIATNDNWDAAGPVTDLVAVSRRVGAFDLPAGSRDAALLLNLPAGQYTALTSDTGGATGIALVELYDAAQTALPDGRAQVGEGNSGGFLGDEAGGDAHIVNLSNRGFVGSGDAVMIAGFVLSGLEAQTLLVRAVGPALESFGVGDVLVDPVVTIYRHLPGDPPIEQAVLMNDNWSENPDAVRTALIADQVHAFPLTAGSKDAAFVVTLPPGVYSAVARGNAGGTGVVLVEVYGVP